MPPSQVIIDTDPGVDDIHALLLTLAADPEDLKLELISVSWGSVAAKSCLRNVVALFDVVQHELEFRHERHASSGFTALEHSKPIVALGAEEPLNGEERSADNFHGSDGMAEIYSSHPEYASQEAWYQAFKEHKGPNIKGTDREPLTALFTPSSRPAHVEILSVLAANPPDTVDIVAIGPLTTIAMAAATDPTCFLRVKRLVMVGGAVDVPGNIIPLAEFNIHADPLAAAHLFTLTSPTPLSTMPGHQSIFQRCQFANVSKRRLQIVMLPLDITDQHAISLSRYLDHTRQLSAIGSPLARFGSYLFERTIRKLQSFNPNISWFVIHDTLCIWYILSSKRDNHDWALTEEEDIRVETLRAWTKGACIVDKRGYSKLDMNRASDKIIGDTGGWLSSERGNRVRICVKSPGLDCFAEWMLKSIYGERMEYMAQP